MRDNSLPFTWKQKKELLDLFDGRDDWWAMTLPQLKYIVSNEKLLKRIEEA